MKKQKILLVEPPSLSAYGNIRILGSFGAAKCEILWAPLDLMIIAGLLRKHNIDSTIFDANATFSTLGQVKEKITQLDPDILIFTTSTTTINNDLKLASLAKEVNKGILTVAIGSHIMVLPQETLRSNIDLDVAVFSEAEPTILDLIRNDLSPKNVKGLCYRKEGQFIRNEPYPPCQNLDEFGIPAHDKVPFHLYRDPMMKRRPMTLTDTQRGCINRCIFCCMPLYNNHRKRSIANVLEELKFIVDLGIKELNFFDAGLTNDMDWSNALFDKIISNKIDLTWKGNTRADHLTLELALKMKEAGCHTLEIGAESADINVLKRIRKNVTQEQVKNAVDIAKKAKINVLVFFSFGWPGETKQSMETTMKFAKSLNTDLVTFSHAAPHPGTEFYRYIEENMYFNTREWEKFDPLYKPVFDYPDLSSSEIHAMVNKAYRSFYLRPQYLMKRAFSIRSFLEARNNIVNLAGFLKRFVIER